MYIWSLYPVTGARYSTRRPWSPCALFSERYARILRPNLRNSTARLITCIYWSTIRPRWRSHGWLIRSKAFQPDGYDRNGPILLNAIGAEACGRRAISLLPAVERRFRYFISTLLRTSKLQANSALLSAMKGRGLRAEGTR